MAGSDGTMRSVNGVVLRRKQDGDACRLQLSLDLGHRSGVKVRPGGELEGSFGVEGCVYRFRTTCCGPSTLSLGNLGQLATVDLMAPRRFHIEQRRRSFRVVTKTMLNARLTALASQSADGVNRTAGPRASFCDAEVVDLGLTGAGLACAGSVPRVFVPGAKVHIEFLGDEWSEPLSLTGLVRRVNESPSGSGRLNTSIGVEFLVDSPADRDATQQIRHYVIERQRNRLQQRSREIVGMRG